MSNTRWPRPVSDRHGHPLDLWLSTVKARGIPIATLIVWGSKPCVQNRGIWHYNYRPRNRTVWYLRDSARFGCILGEIGAWGPRRRMAGISPRMHPKRALSLLWHGPDTPEAFTNNHDRNFISNPLIKLPFNILLIQSVSSAESPL